MRNTALSWIIKNLSLKENWVLLLILIIGAAIRILPIDGLTSGSLSFNEGLSLALSSEPGKIEAPPDQAPLRYRILHYFLSLGREKWMINLPSLLFGLAGILLIYHLGKLLFGANVGFLSSLLLALSLWHIHHSAYAENYTLYVFLSLLSVYWFYKILETNNVFPYVIFIVSSLLGFYAFYPITIIIIVEFLYLFCFFKKTKKQLFLVLVSLFIILAAIFPGLIGAYRGLIWRTNFGGYFWGWQSFEVIPSLLAVFGGIRYFVPANLFIFLLGLFAVLFNNENRRKGSLLFFIILLPCLFFLLCLMLKINITERYFIFIFPFFIILSAYGILLFRNTITTIILTVLFCIPLLLLILSNCEINSKRYIPEGYLRNYNDFRFLADYLIENYRVGDAVVIEHGPGILALQYYLDKENKYPVKIIKPFCGAHKYYRYDGNKIKDLFGLEEFTQTPQRLAKIWKDYNRLWLIDLDHLKYEDQEKKIRNWVEVNFSKKTEFYGGVIYLFDNNLKRNLLEVEKNRCNKDCYLDCAGEIKEIVYPFQGKKIYK